MIMAWALRQVEAGRVPELAIRLGIRALLRQRLADEATPDEAARQARLARLVAELSAGPIAIATEQANEQHYELPPAFFEQVLGPHLKYSSAFFSHPAQPLGEAEAAMLDLTIERAGLRDGMRVLELGCGWGSLTLRLAERFPHSQITALSNAANQRAYITTRAAARGLRNLEVITRDINDFRTDQRYDRVVSVEMFEHLRNYELLFQRIAGWLAPEGRLFVHIFTHARWAYPFEAAGEDDWLARHFFTGGLMPSSDLFSHFDRDLRVVQQWPVNGRHYQLTAEAWLAQLYARRAAIMPILADTYGAAHAELWYQRWRVFFLACAELWGYARGEEWRVDHYLLAPTT